METGRDQDRWKNQERLEKKRSIMKSCLVVVDKKEICPHGRQHLWTHKFSYLPGTLLCIPSSHEVSYKNTRSSSILQLISALFSGGHIA